MKIIYISQIEITTALYDEMLKHNYATMKNN